MTVGAVMLPADIIGGKMKKKLLGIVFCLAMIIGMFPMGVKAAEPAGPTEITLTFNPDDFKYFTNGYVENEAYKRSQNNSEYDDNIRNHILLDETSAKYYFLTPMGLYKKDSSGNFVKADATDKYLNSATDYYLDFVIKTVKEGDSVYNSLVTSSFAIKKISLNGKKAEPYADTYGGRTRWRISIGKPGILLSDVDELSINDLEVRYGKHIPNFADMKDIYNTEDNKRYTLTYWKWTKSGSTQAVTDTKFTDGEYSLTAKFTINKKTSGDFVCKFAGDENKNIKSFKVNGYECGEDTIISDDGHTLTLTHTMPKVTKPIKDIEFTLGELTYLLDNGEYTEQDLATEIGGWRKINLNKAEDFSYDAGKAKTYRRRAGESEITEISPSDKVSDDYTYFVKVGCCLADGASWDYLPNYVGTPSNHRLLVDGVQKELIKIEPYDNITTDSKADYYITFEVGSPKRYDINVSGGKAYVGDAEDNPRTNSYAGLNFTLSADAPEGCGVFKEWRTEGVTVDNPKASKTSFVMPKNNVKLTAVFTAAAPDFTGAEKTYTWTGDSCTAKMNCTKCNGTASETHVASETVTGTYVKDTDATCTAAETGHYEAVFTNTAFTRQSTAKDSVTKGSALGHLDLDNDGHCDRCTNDIPGYVSPTPIPSTNPTIAPTLAPTSIPSANPTAAPTPAPHVCKGEAIAEMPATCTECGLRAYYKCECGKYYEDEACTKEIEDLKAWLADENGGKIAAKGHTVAVDKAVVATAKKNGLTEGSHCSVCNTVLTAQAKTTYTKVGSVYTTSKNTVTYAAPAKTSVKTIEVPATVKLNGKTYKVTAIEAGAFKNCKKLTTVKIGSNVKTVGANAFDGCTKLKKVTIGKSVKTIEAKAFNKCTSLTEIVIPDKVTEIGDSAFNGCTKIKQAVIGKSVKTIGTKAFNGCKKLSTLKILSTKITKISTDAFKGISSKAKITAPSKKVSAYRKLIKASGAPSKVSVTKN